MPAAIAVPAIMSAASTGAALYSSKKARDAAKLPPEQLAQQNRAMQLQNQRMEMTNPLLQRLISGMSSRLPASYGGGAPSIGSMRSPGAGQAVSQLARAMPEPSARGGRQRIIWGD